MQQAIFHGRQDIVKLLFGFGHRQTIVSDLSKIVADPKYCDLIIQIEDREIACHFAIFEARAPEFYQYLLERNDNSQV
jgi:hypothetical protein